MTNHRFTLTNPDDLLGCISAFVLIAGVILHPSNLPAFSLCFFARLTGHPCPGCGLVRSFCCISHGMISTAWQYNPFGFAFYILAIILTVRVVSGFHRSPRIVRMEHSKIILSSWCLLLISVTLFGLLRIISYI